MVVLLKLQISKLPTTPAAADCNVPMRQSPAIAKTPRQHQRSQHESWQRSSMSILF